VAQARRRAERVALCRAWPAAQNSERVAEHTVDSRAPGGQARLSARSAPQARRGASLSGRGRAEGGMAVLQGRRRRARAGVGGRGRAGRGQGRRASQRGRSAGALASEEGGESACAEGTLSDKESVACSQVTLLVTSLRTSPT
jgi:hypothetical protein